MTNIGRPKGDSTIQIPL